MRGWEDSGLFSLKTSKEQTDKGPQIFKRHTVHAFCECVYTSCVSTCEGVCLWLNARLFIRWSEAGVKTTIGPNWSWCW